MKKFSLVMSVYAKESPAYFAQCLDSILSQTVTPDELIIVKDGPLTPSLESVLENFRFPNALKIIALPENVTQGPARAEGVKAAGHEWVAIMDSDDICLPDRFEKQLKMIENDGGLSLIGGQISEFVDYPAGETAATGIQPTPFNALSGCSDDHPARTDATAPAPAGRHGNIAGTPHIVAKRSVPTGHAAIVEFVKKRNPFNSMTVMMKRDLALAAGNYAYFPWFEDYDLWARMIKSGARCANHPDVLVYARVSGGMYSRRRGISYIRSELRMQKRLVELGFNGYIGYIGNIARRVPVRLLPEKGLKAAYNLFARRK